MTALNTEANLSAPDDFYQELLDAHRDLTEAQSALLNARCLSTKLSLRAGAGSALRLCCAIAS